MEVNSVNLVGRLVRDPEVKVSPKSGISIVNGTVAVDSWDSVKKERSAEFIPFVVFGKQAEFVGQYGAKGRQVSITGRLQVRKWEDAEGNKRTATEVIADRVELLGSKSEGKAEAEATTEDFSLFA